MNLKMSKLDNQEERSVWELCLAVKERKCTGRHSETGYAQSPHLQPAVAWPAYLLLNPCALGRVMGTEAVTLGGCSRSCLDSCHYIVMTYYLGYGTWSRSTVIGLWIKRRLSNGISNNEYVVYAPKERMLHPAPILREILNQWIYRKTLDLCHQIHQCK